MNTTDKIRADLKQAMLQKEKLRVSTLRLLISAVRNKEIEKKASLTDEEIIAVVSTEVKKRREAAEEYKKGSRLNLAEKEEKEMQILQKYLPEQLSDNELADIIKGVVEKSGATSSKNMGMVMKELMPKIKGGADGHKVSQMVKKHLI